MVDGRWSVAIAVNGMSGVECHGGRQRWFAVVLFLLLLALHPARLHSPRPVTQAILPAAAHLLSPGTAGILPACLHRPSDHASLPCGLRTGSAERSGNTADLQRGLDWQW